MPKFRRCDQSGGLAGVRTCHRPANAKSDYDYSNTREVASWADDFLDYPHLDGARKHLFRSAPSGNEPDTDFDEPHVGFGSRLNAISV